MLYIFLMLMGGTINICLFIILITLLIILLICLFVILIILLRMIDICLLIILIMFPVCLGLTKFTPSLTCSLGPIFPGEILFNISQLITARTNLLHCAILLVLEVPATDIIEEAPTIP